ncbi:MAG: hypothetical protein KBD56_07020 [Candidatus Eisenbacteria bacterium]|nr:hypothetical protein [Candidatus Eisenbacteria bacterium]
MRRRRPYGGGPGTTRHETRRRLFLLTLALVAGTLPAFAHTEFIQTITTSLGDTETFWVQIPESYDPQVPCPLLIGWHQLGASHLEMKNATEFDEIAGERGWIVMSHTGVTSSHWNNHATQAHVVDVIRWLEERYAIDPLRIYMVGASMGGAAGMIFSNNHLNPAGPMVAAAASLSGIQDCERRFYEQGINNSMIAAFGGTPEQVPFEYHRNSAIVFADSTVSMHVNARHLPLWLTFGHGDSDQVWREHAEDLYAVMEPVADTVVLRESVYSGHGWGCAEERLICDFLQRFTLDPLPKAISINADAEGAWYWARLEMRNPLGDFARFDACHSTANLMASTAPAVSQEIRVRMIHNVAGLELDLASLEFPFEDDAFLVRWDAGDEGPAELALLGVPARPEAILKDGSLFAAWTYDESGMLVMTGDGEGEYLVFLDASSVDDSQRDGWRAFEHAFHAASIVRFDGAIPCLLPAGPALDWSLFDALGRRVASGHEAARAGDERAMLLLPNSLSSGAYLLRLQPNRADPLALGEMAAGSRASTRPGIVRRVTIVR